VPRISMIWAIDLNWLSLPGLVLGSLVGVLVAKVLWSTTKEDRLVLTPEGFIYFSKETPCHIINYEEVKDIQFDSSSTVLTVTTTLLRSKIAIGIFENPEVIAQNIDQACVRFKKSHNMLWAPERQPTKQLEDKFRKTFEKAKDIFQ